MTQKLTISQIGDSALHALSLLARHPFRWPLMILVFLVLVESLMLIPYVGFVLKLTLASLLGVQILVLFADAAQGNPPRLRNLFGFFKLSAASQLTVIVAGLIPFAPGLLYLVLENGVQSIAFFFGNVFKTKPPAPDALFQFKLVLFAAMLPFLFVGAAVAVGHRRGWDAMKTGLSAAIGNPLVLAISFGISAAHELATHSFVKLSPAGAVICSVVSLFAVLAWNFSFAYALAARVFAPEPPAASAEGAGLESA